jgi:cbb3-type cytochrome oxidase subunit 3
MAFLIAYLTIAAYALFAIAYREGREKALQVEKVEKV